MFGFLNCNKPVGFSSRDLVNVIQGRLKGQKIKVGHCGTLDPLADGVLLVGVGPAAKLVPYVHETSKSYLGTFRLAAESPTGDIEVEPTVFGDHPVPSREAVEQACRSLTGWIEQTPPIYSAIKVDGRRAYDLARRGQDVTVPPRRVHIESIAVVSFDYPQLQLEITCGTGTYIRTLGMDLAELLGTKAVMTALTRTRVGQFNIDDAHAVDELRHDDLSHLLRPAVWGVSHLPQVMVDASQCQRLVFGQGLEDHVEAIADEDHGIASAFAAAVTKDHQLAAILARKNGCWSPKRVFPPAFGVGDREGKS